MFNKTILNATEKIVNESDYVLNKKELKEILDTKGTDIFDLIIFANKIRIKYKNDEIYTCTIINAKSGQCSENCAFCSQSVHHNTKIQVYPLLTKDKMLEKAIQMYEIKATHYSFVTSGYSVSDKDIEIISETAKEIKEKTNLRLCASLGILNKNKAERLYEAGIENYHHNLETARSYFNNVCTTHKYEEDINTIIVAKEAGLNVCSGGIMGLGESWEQRVELAYILKDLDVNSIPLNFLNPISGTKMENMQILNTFDALKTIAVFRFINPVKNIGICGGREATFEDFQSWIFPAGANGFMIGNYLTTIGRNINVDLKLMNIFGSIKNDRKYKEHN